MATVNAQAEWTVLGYLAGDNSLAGAAIEDINEMETVGSTNQVNIVVQVDRAADYNHNNDNWRGTRRYYITKDADKNRITSKLLADLGPTNTGDPRFIKDFMRETLALEAYRANRYFLILWNHGDGIYIPPEMLTGEGAPSRREISMRAAPKLRRSFFHSSREKILALDSRKRAICYDDGSSDCLDNQELQQVLDYMQTNLLGGAKIDVVGMDACLMTMIEVAYQIRNQANILVGSEENEPQGGWPYDLILGDLTANPAMGGPEVAKSVVKRYIESHDKGGPFNPNVTQSALALNKLEAVTEAVDQLAVALLKKLSSATATTKGGILTAWQKSTRFFVYSYVDLYDFADNLSKIANDATIAEACDRVKNAITGADSPFIAEGHLGQDMSKVRGLSIYMPPFKNPSDCYRVLDFAKDTKWADFLDAFLKP